MHNLNETKSKFADHIATDFLTKRQSPRAEKHMFTGRPSQMDSRLDLGGIFAFVSLLLSKSVLQAFIYLLRFACTELRIGKILALQAYHKV
jgi:hypothetical protein